MIVLPLFGSGFGRFSDLERAIPDISQNMLIQQLRQFETDGVVTRIVYTEVQRGVAYHMTDWGKTLCPVLVQLRTWAEFGPDEVRERLIHPDAMKADLAAA